jgi:transcriptional regulator with XRE-family HTH domain
MLKKLTKPMTHSRLFSRFACLVFALSLCPSAWAQNTTFDKAMQSHLSNPQLVGQGRYTYWGFDVYQASLWASTNRLQIGNWQAQELALDLRYLRDFSGKDIAQRSMDEMQAQSPIETSKAQAWRKTLERLFPDVQKGQRLTGIYRPNLGAKFLFDNKPLGEITDPELAKRFFDIWLADTTSAPQLRSQLFNLSQE